MADYNKYANTIGLLETIFIDFALPNFEVIQNSSQNIFPKKSPAFPEATDTFLCKVMQKTSIKVLKFANFKIFCFTYIIYTVMMNLTY